LQIELASRSIERSREAPEQLHADGRVRRSRCPDPLESERPELDGFEQAGDSRVVLSQSLSEGRGTNLGASLHQFVSHGFLGAEVDPQLAFDTSKVGAIAQ